MQEIQKKKLTDAINRVALAKVSVSEEMLDNLIRGCHGDNLIVLMSFKM